MASSISVKQAVDFASELKAFIAILAYEGERSLVIGGAARIDVGLERLLKAVMSRGPRGKDDNLFDPDRPLGTFSAKIKLAYRLGLLDDDVEHALQLIRKIRNDFAHATTDIRLLECSHADRVREIVKCVQHLSSNQKHHKDYFQLLSQNTRSTKLSAKRNDLVASLRGRVFVHCGGNRNCSVEESANEGRLRCYFSFKLQGLGTLKVSQGKVAENASHMDSQWVPII